MNVLSRCLSVLLIACGQFANAAEGVFRGGYPTLLFYDKDGITLACMIVMINRQTDIYPADSLCSNKDIFSHYFRIRYPREGLVFTLGRKYSPFDTCDLVGTPKYAIVDPVHNVVTDLVPVDAGVGLPPGKEVVTGIQTANAATNRIGGVGCLKVEDRGR